MHRWRALEHHAFPLRSTSSNKIATNQRYSLYSCTRGIQKVLRQILKNTLFMKFTKNFYIVSIQFITLL